MTRIATDRIAEEARRIAPSLQEAALDTIDDIRALWDQVKTRVDDPEVDLADAGVFLRELATGSAGDALCAATAIDRTDCGPWDAAAYAAYDGADLLDDWQESPRTREDVWQLCTTALRLVTEPRWWAHWGTLVTEDLTVESPEEHIAMMTALCEYAQRHPLLFEGLDAVPSGLTDSTARTSGRELARAITYAASVTDHAADASLRWTCVRVDLQGTRMTLTGADRYRVASQEITLGAAVPETTLMIPTTGLRRAADLVRTARYVTVDVRGTQLVLDTVNGPSYLTGVDTITIPRCSDLAPDTHQASLTARAGVLLDRLEAGHLDMVTTPVILTGHAGSPVLRLEKSAPYWTMHAEAPLEEPLAHDIRVGLSARYLTHALHELGDVVHLTVAGARSPVLLRGKDDASRRHLIAPALES